MPQPEQGDAPDIFYVHPSGWEAFELFQSGICRQWRIAVSMQAATIQGLDYASVSGVVGCIAKRRRRAELIRQIQFIETGALSEING